MCCHVQAYKINWLKRHCITNEKEPTHIGRRNMPFCANCYITKDTTEYRSPNVGRAKVSF